MWNSHFIWETLTGTNFLSCSIANSLRDFVEERYYSFTTHYMQFIFPVSRKQITLGTRFPTDREDLRKEVGKKVHEKEIELPRNCNDSERDDSVKSRTSSYSYRTFETEEEKRDAKSEITFAYFFIFFLNSAHLFSRFWLSFYYPFCFYSFYSPAFALTISSNYRLFYRDGGQCRIRL